MEKQNNRYVWLRLKVVIVAIAFLVIGIGLGGTYVTASQGNSATKLQRKYNFLSKRILIENPNDIIIDFKPLKKNIDDYINQQNGAGKINLYFEYLPTGSSIGFNEDDEVIGASLLKLPVAINIYKLAEEGKVDLDQKIALKQEWLNAGYGTLYQKGEGYKLTVRQAIQYALEDSDNTAAKMLFAILEKQQGSKNVNLLSFVDANYDVSASQTVLIGPQSYSSILKCLYYSCYLSKDHSQQILQYLTQSSAKNRLEKHLPIGTKVAHKIGSYEDDVQSDCGVVYLERRNYLLCVMVKGPDEQASEQIATLSQLVYDSVSRQK